MTYTADICKTFSAQGLTIVLLAEVGVQGLGGRVGRQLAPIQRGCALHLQRHCRLLQQQPLGHRLLLAQHPACIAQTRSVMTRLRLLPAQAAS